MPKKKNYNDVKIYIESFDEYKLISKEYKNNSTKLKIKCPDNHIFEMTYANFKQGKRCVYCSGNKKYSYDYIKEFIELHNYKLLSEKYKNANTKLKLQCSKGHIFEMTYANFYANHRCPTCAKKKYGSYKKLNYDQVKEYIESFDYLLISKEYKNNHNKLKLQCSKGHDFKMSYGNFRTGQRCPVCSKKKCGQYNKLSYNQVKDYIESYNYKLISKEYKNAHKKLKLQCSKGHIFETVFNRFQQGCRCPVCYYESTSSKSEKEIQEFLSNIYDGTIINNDRNIIINPNTGYNLELDIYLPELNKAIEFNGEY